MSLARFLPVFLLVALVTSGQAYSSPYGSYRYGPYQNVQYTTPAYPAYPHPMRAQRMIYPAYYPGYAYTRPPGPGSTSLQVNAKPLQAKTVTGRHTESPVVEQPAATTDNRQVFISSLLPHIEKENRRLLALRKDVKSLLDKPKYGAPLSEQDQRRLKELAEKYRVETDPLTSKAAQKALLRKIDIIPSSLALAQAANESAWGQSYFAQNANNLFGIWTYDEDKGLVPRNREQGKKHLVRIFDDFGESVRYYMHMLNSHPAYADLREIREDARVSGQNIDGYKLAAGLEQYSAKGQQYIDIIQDLIRKNEWARLDMINQSA